MRFAQRAARRPRPVRRLANIRCQRRELDGGNSPMPPAARSDPLRSRRSRQPIARVTEGHGTLPNDAGQVWREYDISPTRCGSPRPIGPSKRSSIGFCCDTGYEAWHCDPFGLLSANRRTLRVYHTPEMQAVVADMVDRFVNTEAESHAFGMRRDRSGSPDWRAKGPADAAPGAGAIARNSSLAGGERRRGTAAGRVAHAAPIFASTARRTCW